MIYSPPRTKAVLRRPLETAHRTGALLLLTELSEPPGPPRRRPVGTLSSMSRVFTMSVASVYPHYVNKLEKKGRTQAELDEVIMWLTGFDDAD